MHHHQQRFPTTDSYGAAVQSPPTLTANPDFQQQQPQHWMSAVGVSNQLSSNNSAPQPQQHQPSMSTFLANPQSVSGHSSELSHPGSHMSFSALLSSDLDTDLLMFGQSLDNFA